MPTASSIIKKPLRVFFGFVLINACNTVPGANNAVKDATEAAVIENTKSATPVQTAIAANRPFDYLIKVNGKIKSLYEQLVMAENNGKVLICKASPGGVFSKGALLAQLETTAMELRIERVKLNLYNAEKEYESQLLGYQSLLNAPDTAQASSIKKKLRISSRLSDAEQDIKEADYELSKSSIRAPFYCRVADVKIQWGGYVRAGQDMFRLYDPSNLVLEVKILESDIALLNINTPAIITPVSAPGKKYSAFVYDINPYIDENGMALIRLKINNESALFPGMNCTAVISIPKKRAVIVPREAIVMRGGKPVVFTMENGQAKWHYVTVGSDNGKEIEIKDGITDGEKVIISNNLQLAHDAPVKEGVALADSITNN